MPGNQAAVDAAIARIGGKPSLKFAEPKRPKEDIFQEALKELHSDAASAATTKKAAAKKPAAKKAAAKKVAKKPAAKKKAPS